MPDRRGQSETLGFVLVFALVVASIGVVYTAGFSGLLDVRDAERVNNAERAFEVLADNMEDIVRRGAPSRATEIKLADARLSVADAIQVEVNVEGTAFNTTYDLRPIVYDADTGVQIVYVQGAIMRDRGDAGLVVSESTLVMNASRTVIPVVETRLSGNGEVAGSTTVLVRADQASTNVATVSDATRTVWFNVTSPRADLWHDHLSDKPDVTCEPLSGDTAACSVTADRAVVTVVRIDLDVE